MCYNDSILSSKCTRQHTYFSCTGDVLYEWYPLCFSFKRKPFQQIPFNVLAFIFCAKETFNDLDCPVRVEAAFC